MLIFNDYGKPRLVRFYDQTMESDTVMSAVYDSVRGRPGDACNIVEYGETDKIIYRHFASLFFCVVVDTAESELAILDLLQVFVYVLDKTFENICELDIVYGYERVNHVLNEVIMSGMVLETNSDVILNTIAEYNKQ